MKTKFGMTLAAHNGNSLKEVSMLKLTAHLIALVAILTWSSTAAAQPVLEVTGSSNPIVGGVVQLNPGDTDVSITFGIVPDLAVQEFDLIFVPIPIEPVAILPITVVDCAAGDFGIPRCPDSSNVQFSHEFINPEMDPFDVGSATISVALNAIVGDAFGVLNGGFIDEGVDPPTAVGGQVYATVVPEPTGIWLLGSAIVALGFGRRRR